MTTTFATAYRAETARRRATNGHGPDHHRTPILVHLGRLAGRVVALLPAWAAIRTLVLALVAFVMLTVAAWGVDWRLGLAVGAVCLLFAELLGSPGGT